MIGWLQINNKIPGMTPYGMLFDVSVLSKTKSNKQIVNMTSILLRKRKMETYYKTSECRLKKKSNDEI